jgi:hypothetical protein
MSSTQGWLRARSVRGWLLLSLLAIPFASARGATIVVDTLTTGASGSLCDLPNAIAAANLDHKVGGCDSGDPGVDVIDLTQIPGLPGVIDLSAPLPQIDHDVTIVGPGASQLRISGTGAYAVFSIALGNVVIQGVTIADGLSSADGGGVAVDAGSVVGPPPPVVQLIDCRVTNNHAPGGGGVSNAGGTLSIQRCLIDANAASSGSGGGVLNSAGVLKLVDSTVSGNSAAAGGGGVASTEGPGEPTDTQIRSSTLAANGTTGSSNLLNGAGATTGLANTLLAKPSGGTNCSGSVASGGHDLADDSSCALHALGDQDDTPAGIAALAGNGGPTATHALQPGSAAIDAGDPAGCFDADGFPLAFDQRGPGFPRVQDGNPGGGPACDIGAFEVAPEPAGTLAALSACAALWALRGERSRRRGALRSGRGRAARASRRS